MNSSSSTPSIEGEWSATYTFSKSTESHAGATIHGEMAASGYNVDDMERGIAWAKRNSVKVELLRLDQRSGTDRKAFVLVLRNAVSAMLDEAGRNLETEFLTEVWPQLDRKFVNFKVVRNKWARGNAEIGPVGHPSTLAKVSKGIGCARVSLEDGTGGL